MVSVRFSFAGCVLLLACAGSSGPAGQTGSPGSPGVTGPAGPAGSAGVVVVATPLSLDDGGLSIATASASSDGVISASDFSRFDAKVDSADPRLSDARAPLAGSGNYLQNTSTPQTANFAISGSGAVGGALSIGGSLTTTGSVTAAALSGDGSGLTNVTAAAVPAMQSAPPCDGSTAGAIYFDPAGEALRVCDGAGFATIGPPPAHPGYCGATLQRYTGALSFGGSTGYRAAKLLCEQTCGSSSAHMCSSEEWLNAQQVGTWPASFPNGGTPWISSGLAFTDDNGVPSTDCAGWTSSASTVSAPAGIAGAPSTQTCDTSAPIVCCI